MILLAVPLPEINPRKERESPTLVSWGGMNQMSEILG